MAAFVALASLLALGAQTKDRFEILAPELKYKEISGLTISPDGQYLLGMLGNIGRSNHVFLIHGKDTQDIVLPLRVKGNPVVLPTVSKGVQSQSLVSVAQDGSLAVGLSYSRSGTEPIVWSPDRGLQSLQDFAKSKNIELPKDWTPLSCAGVGPNGEFIFGTAMGPNGKIRPFRLKLADPPSTK